MATERLGFYHRSASLGLPYEGPAKYVREQETPPFHGRHDSTTKGLLLGMPPLSAHLLPLCTDAYTWSPFSRLFSYSPAIIIILLSPSSNLAFQGIICIIWPSSHARSLRKRVPFASAFSSQLVRNLAKLHRQGRGRLKYAAGTFKDRTPSCQTMRNPTHERTRLRTPST